MIVSVRTTNIDRFSFFFVTVILVRNFYRRLTMINLFEISCGAYKVDSFLQLNFFHTYKSEIEYLTICLKSSNRLLLGLIYC